MDKHRLTEKRKQDMRDAMKRFRARKKLGVLIESPVLKMPTVPTMDQFYLWLQNKTDKELKYQTEKILRKEEIIPEPSPVIDPVLVIKPAPGEKIVKEQIAVIPQFDSSGRPINRSYKELCIKSYGKVPKLYGNKEE